jgi:group I intron endonuclease
VNNQGIYRITNVENGRVYFGSALNFKRRKSAHFYELRNNRHKNQFLQNDYNIYGPEAFEFEIVCHVLNAEDLLAEEQEFLSRHYDNCDMCYNMAQFSRASHKGLKHSVSSRQKISETHKGKIVSEETREKIAKANKGKRLSEETKQRMSEAKRSSHSFRSFKAVVAVELNNNNHEVVFGSLTEAAKFYKIRLGDVSKCVTGRRVTCKNGTLAFRYLC